MLWGHVYAGSFCLVAMGTLMACGCGGITRGETGVNLDSTVSRPVLDGAGPPDGGGRTVELGILLPGKFASKTFRLSSMQTQTLSRVRCDCDCVQCNLGTDRDGRRLLTVTASNQPAVKRNTLLATPIHLDHRSDAKRWTEHWTIQFECLVDEVVTVWAPIDDDFVVDQTWELR